MRKFRRTNSKFVFLLLILVVLIEIIILNNRPLSITNQNEISLEEYANDVIKKCTKSSYKPTCYDEEVPKLMRQISMEDAFKITSLIQTKDPSFGYCHIVGHKLSSLETAKDISKWIDVIPKCPANGMCANGCLHGALQERFRAESLNDKQLKEVMPDLQVACEERENWKPTGLDQAICYHGLGHLTMYITDANFEKSINLCDSIAKKSDGRSFTGVCYEGIFMQLFQPLEPEDFALAKGKTPEKENLYSFCTQFATKEAQQACWEEGWPIYKEEVKTASGIEEFCLNSPNQEHIDQCFNMLFHGVGQGANFDTASIVRLCKEISEERRGRCFANGALSMIQADKSFIHKATSLCSQAQPLSAQDKCYAMLADFARYNFHSGSDYLKRFCNDLPENLQTKCFKGNSSQT